MSVERADALRRFLGEVFDSLVAVILSAVLGWLLGSLGGLIGAIYILLKDRIMYEVTKKPEWIGQSIGKRLVNIRVIRDDGKPVDLTVSAQRNLTLVVGWMAGIFPVLGWIIAALLSPILYLVEGYLVITEPWGRRLGDQWAGTRVIVDKR